MRYPGKARTERPTRRGARITLAGLGLLSLSGYALDLSALFGTGPNVFAGYVALFVALFALYLAAAAIVLRRPPGDPVLLGLILGFGLLFRIVALPHPVLLSSDVYRYLWDGRVHWAGISPYRYPPAAPELEPLRDHAIHPHINRPAKRTIYPPGAQVAFAAVAGIAPLSVPAWRAFLVACEIATAALLLRLLRRMEAPPTAVILYAWAPLAVFEGVHSGHVDAAVVPPLLLALLWRQQQRMWRAGAALGVAILIKLYPVVLLPVWWRRGDWRFPAACIAVVAAGYAPYVVGTGDAVLGFLPEYFGRQEDVNVGLRFFLTEAIGLGGEAVRSLVMIGLAVLLVVVLARIGRGRPDDPPGVFRAGMAAAGAYLVLVPTAMHPWYVMWILPFLAVAPSAAWFWFTGAVTLYYLGVVWLPAPFPLWVRALEFLPLFGLLVWERRAGSPPPALARGGAGDE